MPSHETEALELSGRVALVTGASKGIGRAIALELARRGADIAVNHSSSPEAAAEVAEAIRMQGRRALVLAADVADFAAVQAMVQRVDTELGRLDILINNAGVLERAFLMTIEPEQFARVIGVNLLGTFHGIKAASRVMISKRSGVILNLSSVAAFRGLRGQGAYAASKGGIESLTVVAAKELARFGIRVLAIAPGSIDTGMMLEFEAKVRAGYQESIPLGRDGRVEEVAGVAAFLVSDAASYLTGCIVPIDGGMLRA